MTSTSSSAVKAANGQSYLCAEEYHDGGNSIGPGDSQTFSQAINVTYFPQYYCWDSSDDKEFTYAHAEIFGSGSVTATNWGTGSHTWGAAYLYTLGAASVSGFTNGCGYNDPVWTNPPAVLTISSITAKNLPDNGTSKAGVTYTVNVSVSPGNEAAGQQVVLEDNGVGVAVQTIQGDGTAKISWTPAIKGSRSIQVAWPGSSSALGNITTAYTVNVAGGTGVSINPAVKFNPATLTGTAQVTVDATPAPGSSDPVPSSVPVMLVDAVSGKPLTAAPVAVTGLSTTNPVGTVSIPFAFTPGQKLTLVAKVSANTTTGVQAGQSYALPITAPVNSTTNTTFPKQVYVGTQSGTSVCSMVNLPTTMSPSTATGTVTASGAGSGSATLSGGQATPQWCPPSTPGTYTVTTTYGGDNATMGSSATSGSISVVTGGPIGTNITLGTPSVNTSTGKATVSVSVPGWSGPVQLYDAKNSGKYLGSGTVSNGSGSVSFSFTINTPMTLVPKFSPDGTQWIQGTSKSWEYVFSYLPYGRGAASADGASEMARRGGTRGTTRPRGLKPMDTATRSVHASRRVTSSKRSVTLKCPVGYYPLEAFAASPGRSTAFSVSLGQAGATITSPKANIGTRMQGTALCRATGVGAQVQGAMAFGTRGRDTLRSRSFNAIAWGGPGGDRIGLTGAGAVAWGGQGRDRIVVSGKDSVAAGGPGPDRLVARGANRILLKGGPGPDTLVGGTGPTYINAADGKGGDRVLCRTSQTRAIVDADDRVVGPCTIVTPTR
jgi:hypothetical protein